jgi:hypothetical protein
MAAPDQLAEHQIALASRVPSIHGHYQLVVADARTSQPTGTKTSRNSAATKRVTAERNAEADTGDGAIPPSSH